MGRSSEGGAEGAEVGCSATTGIASRLGFFAVVVVDGGFLLRIFYSSKKLAASDQVWLERLKAASE